MFYLFLHETIALHVPKSSSYRLHNVVQQCLVCHPCMSMSGHQQQQNGMRMPADVTSGGRLTRVGEI